MFKDIQKIYLKKSQIIRENLIRESKTFCNRSLQHNLPYKREICPIRKKGAHFALFLMELDQCTEIKPASAVKS